MGASFQLSFAAVAALVAVYEARMASAAARLDAVARAAPGRRRAPRGCSMRWRACSAAGPAALLFATFCATDGDGLLHGL